MERVGGLKARQLDSGLSNDTIGVMREQILDGVQLESGL